MSRPFYRAEPVHEDIYFVVGQATHDGPLYEVDQCRGWDAACAIIDRLNATAEGLRRIGVAVAVWGAKAAVQQRLRMSAHLTREELLANVDLYKRRAEMWEARARAATYAWDLESRALAAERAARRKWELRLRARARREQSDPDRLAIRATEWQVWSGPRFVIRNCWLPIAGPRGVLP